MCSLKRIFQFGIPGRKAGRSAHDRYLARFAMVAVVCLSMSRFSMGFQWQGGGQQAPGEGECIILKHTFADPEDSLETVSLVECQTTGGLTNWFSSDINQSVCSSNQCRMVSVRLFWDGVGNYHHYELIDQEPLTKTDHAEFSQDDYDKLHAILADSSSIFRDLAAEDLVIEKNEGVDGVSGATRKSLRDYVVGDAVYTCFTLWKIVYGARRAQIEELLRQRTNTDYLTKMLGRNNTAADFWVLNTILGNPHYASAFFNQLVSKITSEDERIAALALRAISASSLKDEQSQKNFVRQMPKVDDLKKLDMIWKLIDGPPVHDQVIVELLHFYQQGILNPTALSYVYKLISPGNLKNPDVGKELKKMLSDPNQYVRNITEKLLAAETKRVP
jgi:hypothetical protein